MSGEPRHCPDSEALGRAFTDGADPALERHLAGCSQCGQEWQTLSALADAARAIRPGPLSEARHARVEAAIMARLEGPGRAAGRSTRRLALAAIVLGAVAAALWLMRPPVAAPVGELERVATYRAQLFEHPGTSVRRLAAQPDEQVRLVEGTLGVEVTPLAAGERFRVLVGDAEVEVVGTAFELVAKDERLEGVLVWTGVVEVRVPGEEPVRLRQGERWLRPAADGRTVGGGKLELEGESSEVAEAPAEIVEEIAEPLAVAVEAEVEPEVVGPAPAVAARAPTGRRVRAVRAAATSPALQEDEEEEAPSAPAADEKEEPVAPSSIAGEEGFRAGFDALRAGEPARAAELLAEVPVGAPLAEDAAYWRGVALARAGQSHASAEVFIEFLRRYPSSRRHDEAAVAVGWLLHRRGDRARARFWFESAMEASNQRVRDSALRGLSATRSDAPGDADD